MDGREATGKHQMVSGGFASEGWNHPGLLIEQDPRVTPSKRNSDAQCQPQGPQA